VEKTAVCFGCRTRYQTFYNRTMRRGRDIDAAGWHLYLAFKQWRVVGTLCRDMSNKTVAQSQHLYEHTVKNLDRRYRQA